jgi:hypothetical protein
MSRLDKEQVAHGRELPVTIQALRFIRSRWVSIVALSALVLLPCYWHLRIEAGDLGSHTYNSWLALLVARGQAPGLYLVRQWNNVVVDLALTWLGSHLGFTAAERIVVSSCVLCFFWGAFVFVAAATRRLPWFLVPAIAMFSYGYTFYAGFMNYYLSLGLAFWAAALFWRGTRTDWIVALFVVILTFMAHPMGFGLLVAMVAYIVLAEKARGGYRWLVDALALLALCAVHFYLLRFKTAEWLGIRALWRNGADQLVLFGARYQHLAEVVGVFAGLCFVVAAVRDWKDRPPIQSFRTPLTLWVLLLLSAALLPGAIWLPQYIAPLSSISSRVTSVTAIVGLCVLGSVQPRKWILAGLTICAAFFFGFQYQDTGRLNTMERQTETLVASLPFGYRVSYTLNLGEDYRINFRHLVERACIGKCFAYSNYEPATGQFRLRLSPAGSRLASSDPGLTADMEMGEYIVRTADLPMAQIYQPDEADLTKLSIRELAAGEKNGRAGYRPRRSEIEQRLHRTIPDDISRQAVLARGSR